MTSMRNIRNISNAAVTGNAGTGFFFTLSDFPIPPIRPFPWKR